MTKKSRFLLGLGIVLLILPFCFNIYSIYRFLSLIIAIAIICASIRISKYKSILISVLLPITLVCLTYGTDCLLYYKFEHMPIYVVESISSNSVSTYNSLFYRIYKCGNNSYLDYHYKLNYMCNPEDLKLQNINEFLLNPYDTYETYNNKFVRIQGKISKIVGVEEIELSTYENTLENINGYVNFSQEKIIKVKSDLSNHFYRIYDYVTVIGLVDTIYEDNNQVIITLTSPVLIPTDIYNDYTFEVIKSKEEKLNSILNEEYYYYGIDKINVIYKENNIYGLDYLLVDERITWEELKQNSPYQVIKDSKNNDLAKKYTLDKFDLIECNNNHKIIAKKDLKISDEICLS